MNQHTYDKFYKDKTVFELLKQAYGHKSGTSLLDQQWYEGLMVHLSKRDLNDKEKLLLDLINQTDPEQLRIQNPFRELEIEAQKALEKSPIKKAGEELLRSDS